MKFFLNLLLVISVVWCVKASSSNDEDFDDMVDQVLDSMATEDSHMNVNGVDPYADPEANDISDPDITKLYSVETIEKFLKEMDDTPVVMGYFDLSTHQDDFDVFEQLAHRDAENYRFGYTSEKAILDAKKYEGCAVYVYMAPKFMNIADDKARARYPNKTINSIVHLKTFIRRNAVPLVGEMTIKNEKLYRNTRLPVVTVFTHIDHTKNEKGFKYIANRVRKVALLWQGKMNFNIANISEYRRDMDQKYDLEEAYGSKAIMVGLRNGSTYYPMEGDFTGEKLKNFVQDFADGKLQGNEQFDSYLNKDEDDPLDDVITLADAARAANLNANPNANADTTKPDTTKADTRNTAATKTTAAASTTETTGDGSTSTSTAASTSTTAVAADADAPGSATPTQKADKSDKSGESDKSKGDSSKKDTKKTSAKPKPKPRPKRKKFTEDDEVVTLSNLNSKQVLANKNADIFVQFHKPDCGLCRHLKPEFRKTANAFKDDGGMIVAAMDVKAHPLPPGFTVDSYPTLYFIPANNKKKPVVYTGKHEAGDMIQYLFQQRTTPVGKGSGLFQAMQQDQLRDQQPPATKLPSADSAKKKTDDDYEDDDDEL